MERKIIISKDAPDAIGPYSQAVWAGDFIYLSGQTPIDPATQKLVEGGIAEQTRQAFDNLEAVLTAAGLSMDNVIKCNVYLVDMNYFSEMNAVYQSRFASPYPARTTVGVRELPLGALVEIELVATGRV
ncbi:MAG: reactive intermediate/imine deaminase [Anaerolinea sp.]|nr:reactive intermediate/imine deaminase [Anaerolinea sp.]